MQLLGRGKTAKKSIAGITIPGLLLLFSIFFSVPGYTGENQCSTLLLNRCEVCHYLTRVCERLDKKSKRGWERTIRTMVRRGARLTPDEQLILAECLADPSPDVQDTCKKYLNP